MTAGSILLVSPRHSDPQASSEFFHPPMPQLGPAPAPALKPAVDARISQGARALDCCRLGPNPRCLNAPECRSASLARCVFMVSLYWRGAFSWSAQRAFLQPHESLEQRGYAGSPASHSATPPSIRASIQHSSIQCGLECECECGRGCGPKDG